jgi:hypothetical protein
VRTQANLNSLSYFDDVDKRKLVSLWTIKPDESDFQWCGKVSIRSEIKGVACGIVTGEQKLYADYNVPISGLPHGVGHCLFNKHQSRWAEWPSWNFDYTQYGLKEV